MLTAVIVFAILAAILGLVLGWASIRFHVDEDPLADQIDALLPQTQCGQCGYAGCKPYAEAIAKGEADINLCAPGGEAGVKALAEMLGVDPKPLDDENAKHESDKIAVIIEDECIGCTKCLQACPVDAIVGAAKKMHTVIESECTGCELCVEPCPVDCIEMVDKKKTVDEWLWPEPDSLPLSLRGRKKRFEKSADKAA